MQKTRPRFAEMKAAGKPEPNPKPAARRSAGKGGNGANAPAAAPRDTASALHVSTVSAGPVPNAAANRRKPSPWRQPS